MSEKETEIAKFMWDMTCWLVNSGMHPLYLISHPLLIQNFKKVKLNINPNHFFIQNFADLQTVCHVIPKMVYISGSNNIINMNINTKSCLDEHLTK